MNRKNGFSLVELMMAVAILGIILSVGAPFMNNVTRVKEKQMLYVRMDNSMGKCMEIIKRSFRNAKTIVITSTDEVDLTSSNSISDNKIALKKPYTVTNGAFNIKNDTENITFGYDQTNKTIYVGSDPTDIIADNITKVEYTYSYALNMLKIDITMTIKDTSKPNSTITRIMSDVVQSRMASR